ncbi:MAG: stage V sporulation protein AD [Firmicutes bacterium]|nr:stage V sporulation protein AD [Bacillota bacterium]
MSGIIKFKNAPVFISSAAVVGKKEHDGPLGGLFDLHDSSDSFGMKTWEQAEGEMQRLAFNTAAAKAGFNYTQLDALFAGDLINQCTSSSYGLVDYDIPFFGIYGACSTGAEGLILASLAMNAGAYQTTAVITSSHNCSAERQFRFPIEYGGQRTPTSQWTVTAAAAFIIGTNSSVSAPYITEALPGRSIDYGIKDANNMGAAMAPAAVDTLKRYFEESGFRPENFDAIFTGDLGAEGHSIVCDLMSKHGYDMGENYFDCGLLMYDNEKQDMHAGGSGCGCSTSVLSAKLLPELTKGTYRDIIWIGTGALLSPMIVQQGKSIPGIAHLLRITKERML